MMSLTLDLLLFYLILMLVIGTNCVQGKTRFTKVPKNPLYIQRGETARLVWNYTVDNKMDEFQLFSPVWSYYHADGKVLSIGYEHFLRNWSWIISYGTCPSRLLSPTIRVSKESTATLVIANVTANDSGTYGMELLLKSANPITSKVQLIVTTQPIFTSEFKEKLTIIEGKDLRIKCSATGVPTPNITWVLLKSKIRDIKSQGVGYAELFIQNITRHQKGTYQCQATNNPNEYPVENLTEVVIWYKPQMRILNWTADEKISLLCLVRGQPRPVITWYYANGTQVEYGFTNVTGGSKLVLDIPDGNSGEYGVYKCKATNEVGWQVSYININLTIRKRPTTTTSAKEKYVTITPEQDVKTKVSSTLASLRTAPDNKHVLPSSTAFYQGKTFAIINLSITCVSVIINAVLITCNIYNKCKRKSLKYERGETCRFSRPVVAGTLIEAPVALTERGNSTTSDDLAKNELKASPIEDYERISEKSDSSANTKNAVQGANDCEMHLSQLHHDYQELSIGVLMPNLQSYQTLNRTLEDSVTRVEPPLPLRKYESLNLSNKPQNSEYQKLHLYAQIGNKK